MGAQEVQAWQQIDRLGGLFSEARRKFKPIFDPPHEKPKSAELAELIRLLGYDHIILQHDDQQVVTVCRIWRRTNPPGCLNVRTDTELARLCPFCFCEERYWYFAEPRSGSIPEIWFSYEAAPINPGQFFAVGDDDFGTTQPDWTTYWNRPVLDAEDGNRQISRCPTMDEQEERMH